MSLFTAYFSEKTEIKYVPVNYYTYDPKIIMLDIANYAILRNNQILCIIPMIVLITHE